MTLKQVIEALIFASPKPLSTQEIVAALRGAGEKAAEGPEHDFAKVKEDDAVTVLAELSEEIRQGERGFVLIEQVNGWALVTHPDAAPWVKRLYPEAKPARLSGPALETLAIIAYRQPVTRADVEAVRGVAVDGVMQVLLDRGLVRIAGRADVPGRPLLYATTEFFLQHFGLKNTDELPNASELKRIVLPTAPPPEQPETKGEKAAKEEPAAEKPAEETSAEATPAAETSSEETAPTEETAPADESEPAAESAPPEGSADGEAPAAEDTPPVEP
jgi:segregation and condensation protein B